jgi:GT2 family glycosyltransferase
MNKEGRVAVVIVNYNGARHISECLEALSTQTFSDLFCVVVDNGSSDGSAELAEDGFPEVELIRSPENLGFAGGNNLAIAGCLERDGVEYVLTLNNDVVLEADCLEKMVATLDGSPGAWSCQPKMYLFRERDGASVLNNTGITIWRDGSAFNRGINEPDRGQYDGATDIFGTCAGCSLYRASTLRETGLFDESFFAYLEDVDLAWRGRLLGYSSVFCPEAECRHHHGATSTDPARKISLVEANRIRVLIKNYAASDIALSPLYTLYRMARLATLGLARSKDATRLEAYQGGLGPAAMMLAVLKGWLEGMKGARACMERRRAFRSKGASAEEARRLVREYSGRRADLLSR